MNAQVDLPRTRIGNCSGFYGDRLSAMREMLTDGPLDYLTGDYLAELTMLILGKDTMRDPTLGYARTFVAQCEDALGLALERGVRIVTNAGGLNPAGLADKLREVARGLGLDPRIAHVEGDDLRARSAELGFGAALTANAYLGGFGIKAALDAGADVVVTGRVTDASVVVGSAAHAHGWTPEDLDPLAGAVVAGHIIECGTQACGGNFSGFLQLPAAAMSQRMGFPIAEVAADGSSVITKHADRGDQPLAAPGGAVTVDTVTAQLVYEIQSTQYLNPDVTADLDSIRLEQVGPDRVAVTGVTGSAPPATLKVCLNELGGFRNTMEFLLTGLDLPQKAAWITAQLREAWGENAPATVDFNPIATRSGDPADMANASTTLRIVALDPDQAKAGKGFTAPAVEIALASYPGCTLTSPPGKPTPYAIYRPEYVPRSEVTHTVVHADGRREVIADPTRFGPADVSSAGQAACPTGEIRRDLCQLPWGRVPLHARSGDKGGNANLGVWVPRDGVPATGPGAEEYAERVTWLLGQLTPARVRELFPEAAELPVHVYALPHLGGVNVVIEGLLGAGVAASTRIDPQAKALGEWFRARYVDHTGSSDE